jgi:hypothetical protein
MGVLCVVLGCRSKMQLPPTWPVRGKVVFRQGGTLPGGTILFQSLVKPQVSASGKIEADGTFELKSFIAGDEASGALAGSHRVTITPPCVENRFTMPPIPPQTIAVSKGDNNLTITIDKP